MVSFPPCKINLGLHVISKRTDGFHELETCFYPVQWTDILEVNESEAFSFTSSGTVIPGAPSDNLCVKAYRMLQQLHDLPPVKIHLHKIIPTGAGLGGGSSDAAHTLRLLNSVFSLNLTTEQLMRYAARLGSDCPFFVQDQPMVGTGRGEVLSAVTLSLLGKYLILLKPDIHVSTADAYAGIRPKAPSGPLISILENGLSTWKDSLKNDFEETVFAKHREIMRLKETLYEGGAVYASMSGSGSTVFGIFDKQPNPAINPDGTIRWRGWL